MLITLAAARALAAVPAMTFPSWASLPHVDHIVVKKSERRLLISYPNARDVQRARTRHWQPGGSIEIHGQPNRLTNSPYYYQHFDWTDGCIAVSDADMIAIWMLTRDGMPIDIFP